MSIVNQFDVLYSFAKISATAQVASYVATIEHIPNMPA